ncbi:hypothetical protein P7K49_025131 [Saguinus oedipus]|uniref:Uncharacterized protein n=1 Tax=Saguinus oedipus TaxID=9490 RepID=A0ABQ9UII6_SAGOE|nr:hypothetical protein P7K49_025131 [Saguinus oedipus]
MKHTPNSTGELQHRLCPATATQVHNRSISHNCFGVTGLVMKRLGNLQVAARPHYTEALETISKTKNGPATPKLRQRQICPRMQAEYRETTLKHTGHTRVSGWGEAMLALSRAAAAQVDEGGDARGGSGDPEDRMARIHPALDVQPSQGHLAEFGFGCVMTLFSLTE